MQDTVEIIGPPLRDLIKDGPEKMTCYDGQPSDMWSLIDQAIKRYELHNNTIIHQC
jgi:hypothetical protein